jgi:DNA-binding response OmpR family regulator
VTKKKVLIIDDERLIVKSTGMALKYFGYDTLEAFTGESGFAMAQRDRPDIILLDIMMPGMDGWEVLSRLSQEETTKGIPVIIFTAKEYSNGSALARSKGASDYIAKPFEPEALHKLIVLNLSLKE